MLLEQFQKKHENFLLDTSIINFCSISWKQSMKLIASCYDFVLVFRYLELMVTIFNIFSVCVANSISTITKMYYSIDKKNVE